MTRRGPLQPEGAFWMDSKEGRMDKAGLRRQLRDRLRALSAEDKDRKSRQACQGLVSTPPYQRAAVVMMFLSMPDEIDMAQAMRQAWQEGKTVVVPKVDWDLRTMTPVRIDSLDAGMTVGRGGLRNPAGGQEADLGEIDVVVTPGLAFDTQGHRLGRGAGFYDRFFADPGVRAVRCGICFQEQVVESVPVAEADRPVDWLVTDEQVLCIRGPAKK
jgi:5-formyltetrahydrofolate cyclo-ligase